MDEFFCFTHLRINDHVYLVRESFGFDKRLPNSYFFIGVVIGKKRIAVIDSGNGATPGLRRYIEQNIAGGKEMICLLTHNHLDHIGGCMLFDKRYMHEADIDPAEISWATNLERHFFDDESDFAQFCCHDPQILEYCRKNYLRERATVDSFIPIRDGDEIDLGEISMKVYHTPGHSRGSCCFYDENDHIVFVGDAITAGGLLPSPVLVDGESETLCYLKRAKREWAADSLICGGHHMIWGMDLVEKLLDGFSEIEEGRNLLEDTIAGPSPFKYKSPMAPQHKQRPGNATLVHYHKDIKMNYRVQIL